MITSIVGACEDAAFEKLVFVFKNATRVVHRFYSTSAYNDLFIASSRSAYHFDTVSSRKIANMIFSRNFTTFFQLDTGRMNRIVAEGIAVVARITLIT